MKLIGIVRQTLGTIYEYLCESEGDRLTWQPRR
jgi:hypothetical protein